MDHPLRRFRATARMSQDALAALVGLSKVQISRIERGESGASLRTAAKLEELTGIPAVTFVKREAQP